MADEVENRHILTKNQVIDLFVEYDCDIWSGMEYLHGLEVDGLYSLRDVMRFISR